MNLSFSDQILVNINYVIGGAINNTLSFLFGLFL